MRIKSILRWVVPLAICISVSIHADEQPQNTNGAAENSAEAQETEARAKYEAAEQAARGAEAALGPLRNTMQEADKAYADGARAARAARQKATEARRLAGEEGEQELEQAEAAVPAAIEALTKAREEVPPLGESLEEARTIANPLQEAYDAAEKVAKETEAAARTAAQAANRLDEEAERATGQAEALRTAADTAQAALDRAQQNKERATQQAEAARTKLAEAEAQKKAADEALADAREQLAAAPTLARATAQMRMAEGALGGATNQVAAARKALAAAEEAAQAAEKLAAEKQQAADQAAAKRKAVADAEAALAKARESGDDEPVAAAEQRLNEAKESAQELLELDAAAAETAAVAATKRKVADEARAALAPKAERLEQAVVQHNQATQALSRAESRKESAEKTLADLKERIAAAKESHAADEQAAEQAEAAAVPLREEAERTRAEYNAAVVAADEKRIQAQQARAALYRMVFSRQAPDIMETSEPPKPSNRIDEIIFAKLETLGIEPALCSDAVFIRRAYLDITGRLPTAETAKAFIQDSDPDKRAALVDRLLDRPGHADYWAMRWSDILRVKAEFPVTVWPNAAQAYHRWIWESVAQNKPHDQFARELLTSSGSNFRVGPVNFYRAVQEETPETLAASVALALMASRIHLWPEEIRAGTAVFFSQVGYKPTSEWKEEIVFWDPLNSVAVPGSIAPGIDDVAKSVTVTNQIPQGLAEPISMNSPLEAIFPDGTKVTIPPDRDPRKVFADWLIQPENPWFAQAIANRIWTWAMGRGIVHEPDDFREDNPPSNPELLDYLAEELVSSGWDLKHLKRLIFTSAAYQFSSIPRFDHPEAVAHFASYPLRRVEAEVLIDALNDITGSSDLYTSAVPEPFTYIPEDMGAVRLADGSITSSFLALFGRSGRDTGMEAERVSELRTPQWLYLLNSAEIQRKLQDGPRLRSLVSSGGSTKEIAEELYLTILSRFPTEADIRAVEEYAKTGVAKGRDVWIDLAWALINSPEFLLRH